MPGGRGASFAESQFREAIRLGSVSMLPDDLGAALNDVYAAMNRANTWIRAEVEEFISNHNGRIRKHAEEAIAEAAPLIENALEQLRGFLSHAR